MRYVLITGANRGIGFGLLKRFAAEGNRVIGTYRDAAKSKELLELAKSHSNIVTIQADVSDVSDRSKLSREAQSKFGKLDWVIHNAGIAAWGTLDAESEQQLLQTFRVNVASPILLTRELLPLLKQGEKPKVWLISSKMGSIAEARNMGGPNYSYPISKAALNMAGVQLALELSQYGISVHLQTPGWVKTEMGGSNAELTLEQSVDAIFAQFERLTEENSGEFYEYDGSPLPF